MFSNLPRSRTWSGLYSAAGQAIEQLNSGVRSTWHRSGDEPRRRRSGDTQRRRRAAAYCDVKRGRQVRRLPLQPARSRWCRHEFRAGSIELTGVMRKVSKLATPKIVIFFTILCKLLRNQTILSIESLGECRSNDCRDEGVRCR